MKSFLFWCLIALMGFDCFSQEDDRRMLEGHIINDSINKSNINIFNKNLSRRTGTNELGIFEIPVRIGDSILISAINIKPKMVLVTNKIFSENKIEITVEEKLNVLDEVVLKNHHLTGSLLYDMQHMSKKSNPITKEGLDFSATLKSGFKPDLKAMRAAEVAQMANTDPTSNASSGGGGANILGGISMIAKLFKKKKHHTKSKKNKLTGAEQREKFRQAFVKEYGMSFFTNTLKIPATKIDDFLNFCRSKKDFIPMYSKNQKLELINFFVLQSKKFNTVNPAK